MNDTIRLLQVFTDVYGRNSCHMTNIQYGHFYNKTKATQQTQLQYRTKPV